MKGVYIKYDKNTKHKLKIIAKILKLEAIKAPNGPGVVQGIRAIIFPTIPIFKTV